MTCSAATHCVDVWRSLLLWNQLDKIVLDLVQQIRRLTCRLLPSGSCGRRVRALLSLVRSRVRSVDVSGVDPFSFPLSRFTVDSFSLCSQQPKPETVSKPQAMAKREMDRAIDPRYNKDEEKDETSRIVIWEKPYVANEARGYEESENIHRRLRR